MANPSDTTYHIIKETTAGTTPSSPAFLKYDHKAGDNMNFASDVVSSQLLKANRAAAGSRKTQFRAEGAFKGELHKDTAADILRESAFSGTFTSNVAKAGNTDVSFTVEKKMVEGATSLYARYTGCQVSKYSLSVDTAGMAEESFDIIGRNQTTGTTAIASSTYTASSTNMPLAGLDASVSVAGLTVAYSSAELSVEHDREAHYALGSAAATNIGTGGFRKVTLKVTFYRNDWTPETLLIPDTPLAVSLTVGGVANGYTFLLPAAYSSIPTNEEDGSKTFVTVEFTAAFDATEATDLKVTRL